MKNFDEMSDFEVNAELSRVTWLWASDVADAIFCHKRKKIKVISVSGFEFKAEIKDYCNSWSDMGPLIVDNKISLISIDGDQLWQARSDCLEYPYESMIFLHHSEWIVNPLRAAAICLIKKLEADNEQLN